MIQEEFMACGSWDVVLKSDAPRDVRLSSCYPFGWFVVTPSRLYDSGIDRATLLANARFSGVIRARELSGGEARYSGPSIFALLGDEEGKGPSRLDSLLIAWDLDTVWSTYNSGGTYGLFNTFLNRVNGLTAGTVYDNFTFSVFDVNDSNPSLEAMITRAGILEEFEEEELDPPYAFRVNPDGSCDVGESSASTAGFVYTTPKALIWNGPSSTEPDGTAVLGNADIRVSEDHDSWIGYCRMFYNHSGSAITSGTSNVAATRSHSYKGFDGSLELYLDITQDDAATTTLARARGLAKREVRERAARYDVSASVDSRPDLRSYLRPGDYCWAWEPDIGLDRGFSFNTGSYEAVVGGVTLNPAKLRCMGYRYPITEGMGVYFCSNDWTTITDVSEWVRFEDGPTDIEFGEDIRKRTLQNLVKTSNYWRSI